MFYLHGVIFFTKCICANHLTELMEPKLLCDDYLKKKIRLLLPPGKRHSNPLSKGNLWACCRQCNIGKLSKVSSSPLLSPTGSVRIRPLWICGSTASVWTGHLHLPGKGTDLSGKNDSVQ